MKKKILFVFLALALIAFFFHVHPTFVEASEKAYLTIKGKKTNLSKKTTAIYVGEKKVSLSYFINGKKKGVKGTWTSSNPNRIRVSKNGTCKALQNGTATITFRYKLGKKAYLLKTKLKAYTRAEEITLFEESSNSDSISVKPFGTITFKTSLTPSEEALEVNPNIKSSDKVFYTLCADEACKTPTDLGVIDTKGSVKVGEYGGVMYLRAMAKPHSKSKSKIYSNVATITIEGLTKEEKLQEEERKRKEALEQAAKERLKPARIEIMPNAPLYRVAMDQFGFLYAYVYYKIYNGNGQEITKDSSVLNSNLRVTWNGGEITNYGNGTALATLYAKVPGKAQNIGSTGQITVRYKDAEGREVSATSEVRVMPPAFLTNVELKGIYKAVIDPTTNSVKYEAVLDETNIRVKKGDKIQGSGGHIMINTIPDSYYLLLKATDSYNHSVTDMGMKEDFLRIEINGKTNLAIDETKDIYDKSAKQSIKPIVVDGMAYLTYPLKATEVGNGEMQILLSGGAVRKTVTKTITDGSTMLAFYLTAGTVDGSPIEIGKENSLDYYLLNSKGERIKEYELVLYYLKLSDPHKIGVLSLPFHSEIISSSKNSFFKIRKNAKNGEAELIYQPQVNVLLTNNPTMPIANSGIDEVTILRGFGEGFERKVPLMVTRKP